MKTSSVFTSWKDWLTGWWSSSDDRHCVLDVLGRVVSLADHAIPIVDIELAYAVYKG